MTVTSAPPLLALLTLGVMGLLLLLGLLGAAGLSGALLTALRAAAGLGLAWGLRGPSFLDDLDGVRPLVAFGTGWAAVGLGAALAVTAAQVGGLPTPLDDPGPLRDSALMLAAFTCAGAVVFRRAGV